LMVLFAARCRADLAALLVECIDDDATISKIYHAVDPGITWEAPLQRGENFPERK